MGRSPLATAQDDGVAIDDADDWAPPVGSLNGGSRVPGRFRAIGAWQILGDSSPRDSQEPESDREVEGPVVFSPGKGPVRLLAMIRAPGGVVTL